ncbi:MAG: cytidine deaminase [Gemmatimonadaceae bacterium]
MTEAGPGPRTGGGESLALSDRMLTVLRERAFAALDRAYAPYSSFRVGAALLGTDGSVAEGCNVENAAYPAGICAERGALACAVARGVRSFEAIAIATDAAEPTPPCGMCLQALAEFAPRLTVVSVTRAGATAHWTLGELLPHVFAADSMARAQAGGGGSLRPDLRG